MKLTIMTSFLHHLLHSGKIMYSTITATVDLKNLPSSNYSLNSHK